MIQKQNIIGAVDVGTTKIVAIIAQKDEHGEIKILGFGREKSVGIQKGDVLNVTETVRSISNAFRKAEEEAGVSVKEVYVGMAGHHIRSKEHQGNLIRENEDVPISKEDVELLMRNIKNLSYDIGYEVIHVIPKSFTVNHVTGVNNPIGCVGKKLEASFHVVIGEMAPIRLLRRCVEDAGYKVKKIFLEPLASGEAVLLPEEKEMGVAVVDIGGGTTDLAVYYEGSIQHTAVIPFGGNIITEDLKKTLQLLERDAEKIKVNFGNAIVDDPMNARSVVAIKGYAGYPEREIDFRTIADIIQARMSEILEMVISEIKRAQVSHMLTSGIVVTGGGALLKNLPQLVAYHSGKLTRIGYPRVTFISDNYSELNNPCYSTILGLVLLGFEDMAEEDININEVSDKKEQEQMQESENSKHEDPKTEEIYGKPKGTRFKIFENLTKSIFELKATNMNEEG
ncbi:MAG TPA: cell division protein FtsA [Salinivirgaceae bacterium]|nr:cell division protein FtsA [Salinivirgaceae bacterium]